MATSAAALNADQTQSFLYNQDVAARELIFVTTSTLTREATHASEGGRLRDWLTMIDCSRLLTIVIACWEHLPVHWQARLVGQEQS